MTAKETLEHLRSQSDHYYNLEQNTKEEHLKSYYLGMREGINRSIEAMMKIKEDMSWLNQVLNEGDGIYRP